MAVEHCHPSAHHHPRSAVTHPWVAESSVKLAKKKRSLLKKVKRIITDAKAQHDSYLQTGHIGEELLKSTLLLAQLDLLVRPGKIYKKLGKVDKNDVQDLSTLISLAPASIFKAKNLCMLNPRFGAASLVGGADADLVLDEALIEIKTTKYLRLDREHFNQLLGYYILYKIRGIVGVPPSHEIRQLGIYFSRYAHLYLMDVEVLIYPDTFPRFIKWFKRKAQKILGHQMELS